MGMDECRGRCWEKGEEEAKRVVGPEIDGGA